MAIILITFTAILLTASYQYSQALPILSLSAIPELFNTYITVQDVDPNCNKAGEEAAKVCNQTTHSKWENVYNEMIKAQKKGEEKKYEELKLELTCCVSWDYVDCIEANIQGPGKCTKEDYKKIYDLYEWAKQQRDKEKCQDYPYKHKTEKCKP